MYLIEIPYQYIRKKITELFCARCHIWWKSKSNIWCDNRILQMISGSKINHTKIILLGEPEICLNYTSFYKPQKIKIHRSTIKFSNEIYNYSSIKFSFSTKNIEHNDLLAWWDDRPRLFIVAHVFQLAI